MKTKWQILLYTGIVAIGIYLVLAATAYLHYPGAYSRFTNWLSDLGNPIKNLSGDVFYNLAGILTNLAMIPFFVWLFNPNSGERTTLAAVTVSIQKIWARTRG